MKPVAKIIRAIVLIAFLILAQVAADQLTAIKQHTYNPVPLMLLMPLVAILFGALLRSDIIFVKNKVFKVDWLSLAVIGIPSLLLAFAYLIIASIFPNLPLPRFMAIVLKEQFIMFSGVVFGYTVVNSLFTVKDCK